MDKQKKLISLVMPAYNAADYINQAIDSILAQTYENWELLVADDGSKDNTKQLVAAYKDSRIKVFHNEKNLGYQSTCNRLFSLCNGDFLTFQDADDYSAPRRLELLLNTFLSNPAIGMVGSAYDIVSYRNEHIETILKPLSNSDIRKVISHQSPFCGATIMVKKEVYDKVGLYRPFFEGKSHQDYDWAYRVSDLYQSCNLSQVLYFYRQNPGGNSKKIKAERYIGFELAKYLGKQRSENKGYDDLMLDKEEDLQQYVDEVLLAPYKKDPALIYRTYAASFMYNKMYREAREAAWQAFRIRPMNHVNFRTWFYCYRHSKNYLK